MSKLRPALMACALLIPALARGGSVFELSAGSGLRWEPAPVERVPTNVMLAGGYSFGVLKLELGMVGDFSDVKNSKFDLDLRPMMVLQPPVLPFYLRGMAGVSRLVEGPAQFSYGAALGARMGLAGVGAFLEAGALSRRVRIDGREKDSFIAEGRLGVYWD